MIQPTIQYVLELILDGACPGNDPDPDGYCVYSLETHCVEWEITAKKQDGSWVIKEIK